MVLVIDINVQDSFLIRRVLVIQSIVSGLYNLMDCIMPGFPVLYCLLELAQTYVHQVDDAIQPSVLHNGYTNLHSHQQ